MRIGIILALAMIVLCVPVFMPGEAHAGQIGQNAPPQCVSRNQNPSVFDAKKYCELYGDQEFYCFRPESCNGKPVPALAGLVRKSGDKGRNPLSRTSKSNAAQPETSTRQTSATLLSLLTLTVGLLGILWCGRKMIRTAFGSTFTQVPRRMRTFSAPQTACLACFIAVLALTSSARLATRGTEASSAPPQQALAKATRLRSLQVSATAAEPQFSSAFQIGGNGVTQIGGTAVDAQGNTYVTGGFSGDITFNTAPQPTTLTSTEAYDVFVAKYDAAGQPLWARMANGTTGLSFTDPDTNQTEYFSLDGALSLAVDAQGNAYIGGGFVKSLTFKDADGETVATLGDDAEAESDEINFELFVAKYNAAGTLVWARGGDSGSLDDAEAEEDLDSGLNGITEIVVDQAGHPYVAGTFSGTNFLGEAVSPEGARDILLSRLDPANGNPVWVSTPGSTEIDAVLGLAVDTAANLYLIGDMGGTITFPTQPNPTTLPVEDEFRDSCVAKYNQNGQALWAKQIGGSQPIDGTHIAVSGAGQLYLTGAFEGEAKFDSITITDPSAGSGSSGFLTKYTTDGNALWVRAFGRSGGGESSDNDVAGYRVTVDGAGAPYVSGIFQREATFGQETPATSRSLTSDRLEDQFVAHYDDAGNFRWVKQPVESGGDAYLQIGSEDVPIEVLPMRLIYNDAAKALLLAGDFRGMLSLDDITLNSGSARRAYVAVLTPPHPVVISEFRFRGPDPDGAVSQTGQRDEFVELYNQSNYEVDLGGWALAALDTNGTPSVVFNFPTNASVPPRGHYLLGGADYSLGLTPDGTLNFDIPDGSGIALFYVGTTLNASTLVDAAGFSSVTDSLYREGPGLTPAGGITEDGQHSFVRRQNTGTPQDTGNNENDFLFVSTNAATYSGRVSALGAPGPESTASHVQRNAGLKASLIDPQCAGFGAANSACARVRAGGSFPNAAYGTLAIRRKFTNTTGAPVTALRFRVVDITTNNSPGYVSSHAILRVLSSGGATVNNGTITITGATLEPTPSQPNGGGYNSALAVALPGGGLADGDSINVEFLLGVEQNGSFRFYVNVEAVPGPASASMGSSSNPKTGSTKATSSRKQK
jgi:hypothetical protein